MDVTLGNTREKLYFGGDAYSAPMVYVRDNNSDWVLYDIVRDYQGSITHLVDNSDGTVVAEYSYDPWGRLRDPETLEIYTPGSSTMPDLMLGRGYTAHEHLDWFGLINMNARLYDPALGRFLSPDPYVQAPDFTQNFNRYSYCLNNPLKYTDKSGEIAFTTMFIIGGITAAIFGVGNLAAHAIRGEDLGHWKWANYFFSGAAAGFLIGSTAYAGWAGLSALSGLGGFWGGLGTAAQYTVKGIAGIHALSSITGIVGGTIQNGWKGLSNAGKIMLGLFYLDENASFIDAAIYGYLRHTWEFLQTGFGYDYTMFRNAFGSSIDRVDYLGGTTFATNEHFSGKSKGITIGSYCNMDIRGEIGSGRFDDYVKTHPLYMHEYGHTIDSRSYGMSYLFAIGIPSFISAIFARDIDSYTNTHDYKPYEMRANSNAKHYFGKYYGVSWASPYGEATIEAYYPTHL